MLIKWRQAHTQSQYNKRIYSLFGVVSVSIHHHQIVCSMWIYFFFLSPMGARPYAHQQNWSVSSFEHTPFKNYFTITVINLVLIMHSASEDCDVTNLNSIYSFRSQNQWAEETILRYLFFSLKNIFLLLLLNYCCFCCCCRIFFGGIVICSWFHSPDSFCQFENGWFRPSNQQLINFKSIAVVRYCSIWLI